MKILTWERLAEKLPLLNQHQIERECGLRPGRLYDCKTGRSTLSSQELETIRRTLHHVFS